MLDRGSQHRPEPRGVPPTDRICAVISARSFCVPWIVQQVACLQFVDPRHERLELAVCALCRMAVIESLMRSIVAPGTVPAIRRPVPGGRLALLTAESRVDLTEKASTWSRPSLMFQSASPTAWLLSICVMRKSASPCCIALPGRESAQTELVALRGKPGRPRERSSQRHGNSNTGSGRTRGDVSANSTVTPPICRAGRKCYIENKRFMAQAWAENAPSGSAAIVDGAGPSPWPSPGQHFGI